MPSISISKDLLVKAIAAEVKRQSFGNANMDITHIEGVIDSGEAFEIVGIRVQTEAPKVRDFVQRSEPAGRGKIRLAAVNGVAK